MLHNKIYALCDFELIQSHNFSLEKYISHISKYNVVYIQYRDKVNSVDTQKENLKLLKSLTNIPIIINDKLELLEYAGGLHLGQEDVQDNGIDFNSLRQQYPTKIFGLSTHNKEEILEANKLPLDYIGLGAYRNTSTKKDISGILGSEMSKIAKHSKHPVGAIGGVKVDDDIENITYNVVGSALLR